MSATIMFLFKVIFFIGIIIIFYSYIGYGLFLWFWIRIRNLFAGDNGDEDNKGDFLPPVTLIVAAYNEEEFISEKIQNTLSLDYPEENLKIIFVTDGSTDNTLSVAGRFSSIQILHKEDRQGKAAAMHRAMSFVKTPYTIFSDANTLLNKDSIRNIVRHYQNTAVGGVAGEKKILQSKNDTITAAGEGLYWKYESFLKELDWKFYTVVGAAGELFSIRTELYEHPGDNIILDDFIISLRICQKGYRVAYEAEAYAIETASSSMKEEQKRKIRISAGAFQSMYILRDLLNVFKYPKLSFQYISHRVLRWTLCPLFLPLIFISNIVLFIHENSIVYGWLLSAQLLFYGFAFAGWLLFINRIRVSFLYAPYYFVFINISLYLGFFRFLNGKQTVLWEKAAREKYKTGKALTRN